MANAAAVALRPNKGKDEADKMASLQGRSIDRPYSYFDSTQRNPIFATLKFGINQYR